MNFERAQQIIRSKETIQVRHGDKPVWIESLDPARETASVSAGGKTYTVPVEDLVEGSPGFKVV